MWDFWFDILKIVFGIFGFTALMATLELYRTTQRLKLEVENYIKAVNFEWENQTAEFALMDRVRAFEVLLRNVQAQQPRTPIAYRRVEQVRDALEFFHRTRAVHQGQHLPLPKLEEFPIQPPSPAIEAHFRSDILKRLRAIKWLGLKSQPSNE